MKKITLLSMLFTLAICFNSYAQTLNQNASWPNGAWILTGTYSTDPLVLESDPTVAGTSFAYDDDDAGSGNEDNIAAESPVIDLTAAHTAGEMRLNVTSDYVYNYSTNDELVFQYWDVDGASWVNWGSPITADTAGAPTDNFCSGTPEIFTSDNLDITGFTGTQLSGFRYRISYDDDPAGADWNYGFCFQSPTITSTTPPTNTADWNNLQWPPNGAITTGSVFDVYGQVYEAGVTDGAGQAAGIEVWFGTSTADTDPSTGGWTWSAANYNTDSGNNDEYTLEIGSGLASGTYYYASRFRVDGGPFTYGGIMADGSGGSIWDGTTYISGVLTVTDPPPPANDDCANATPYTNDFTMLAEGGCSGTPNMLNLFAATDDTGNDNPSCDTTGNYGVWYTWTATSTGLTFTSGAGSPGFAVYEAGSCGSLVNVGCLNNSSGAITGLTISNDYMFYIWDDTAGNSVDFCLEEYTPPPPPANDICSGAMALTPGVVFTDNPIIGTNTSTSDSGETAPGCASYSGGDLWYSVVVPPNGNITLEMDSNPTANGGDGGGAAYSGSCGALVLISCNDDGGPGLYPQVVVSDPSLAGQTIYFRVWEYGNNATIDFQVSAYSATLSVEDNTIEGFSIYPNPVNDVLRMNALDNIESISIYNLLGQEVMRAQPNVSNTQIDISELTTGMYVVKVQVGDQLGAYRIMKK